MCFIARVNIFIEKRPLIDFLRFFSKTFDFLHKKLFGHFHYFLSIIEHEFFIKILSKVAHLIEKTVLCMIISFEITNIKSAP